jgi:hypothetical protein
MEYNGMTTFKASDRANKQGIDLHTNVRRHSGSAIPQWPLLLLLKWQKLKNSQQRYLLIFCLFIKERTGFKAECTQWRNNMYVQIIK